MKFSSTHFQGERHWPVPRAPSNSASVGILKKVVNWLGHNLLEVLVFD